MKAWILQVIWKLRYRYIFSHYESWDAGEYWRDLICGAKVINTGPKTALVENNDCRENTGILQLWYS